MSNSSLSSSPARSSISTTAIVGANAASSLAVDDLHFPSDLISIQDRKDDALLALYLKNMEVNIRLNRYFARKKAEPIRDVNQPQAPHRDEVYHGHHRLHEVGASNVTDSIVEQIASPDEEFITMRGSVHSAWEVYSELSADENVTAYIDIFGFSHIFSEGFPNSDNKIVEALASRWSAETHTIHLPFVELRITPFDFVHLTGITVGVGNQLPPFPNHANRTTEHILATYYPGLNNFHIQNRSIALSSLKEYLLHWADNTANHPATALQVARVFIIFVCGSIFFPNAKNTILVDWATYLDNFENMAGLDWGSAIRARIYYALDVVSRREVKQMNCFWQVLEF